MNYQEYVEYVEGLYIEENIKRGYPSHLLLEEMDYLTLDDMEQYLIVCGYNLNM
jgi:hypothetical protein